MVREQGRASRPRAKRKAEKPESIWDSPRIKAILAEPFGIPFELTREEALAVLDEHMRKPKHYDEAGAERRLRELKQIRRESGAIFVRPSADD